ncbi:MAG: hypothetical protein KAX11_08665 [Candidatus Aminicenantes bacterium]|nr:hypothetical protein [Candidatus Aminicenantes bacterium]
MITFLRADFSQPKKQAWTFVKYSVVFLVVFAGLFLAITAISGGLRYDERIYSVKPSKRDIFFTSVKGIYKYSSDEDTVEKIIKNKPKYSSIYSIRAGKIIYYQHYGSLKGYELCMMNEDGSGANLLIQGGYKAKDPDLHWLQSSIISPDASQVAFLTHGIKKGCPIILWRVNSDGTGLKKFPLNVAGYSSKLIAWPEFENSVYINSVTYPNPQDIRILKFDFQGETQSFVPENLSRPYPIGVSPQHDKIAFVAKPEETNPESLVCIDLKTNEKRVILEEDPLILRSFKWNEIGSECIFSIDRPKKNVRLFHYSIPSGEIRKLLDIKTKQEHYYNMHMRFDWIFENTAFVVYYTLNQNQKLEILDLPSLQRKTIKIPDEISNNCSMHTADDKVFFHVFNKRDLWRLDLRTEKWKRVY